METGGSMPSTPKGQQASPPLQMPLRSTLTEIADHPLRDTEAPFDTHPRELQVGFHQLPYAPFRDTY